MSVPFLTTDKSGVVVRFPKALYFAQILPQLQELFSEGALTMIEDGPYLEFRLKGGSEQNGYDLCERFFYLSKNVRRT
jgi:hypothetical protein